MSAFSRLRRTVQDARQEAHKEARGYFPFTRSRGTLLCTAGFGGDQCAPRPEAEAMTWEGTKAEIEHLIDDVQAKHPHVGEIYIAGGFDGADRLSDFKEGNYEPWVSSWKVTLWTRREDGTVEVPGGVK